MNPTLAGTFTTVAQGLLQAFGREVRHGSNGPLIFAVIREVQDAIDLGDPFPQRHWTARVAKSTGVAPGNTLMDGADTWRIEGILNDDGFVVTLAIRKVTA